MTSVVKTESQEDKTEDLELMRKSDREIAESITRFKRNLQLLGDKLPDGGEKCKVNIRRHEHELERRKKLQSEKAYNGCDATIQVCDHSNEGALHGKKKSSSKFANLFSEKTKEAENPELKKIRKTQPSKQLQDALDWDQLIESVDLNKSKQVRHVSIENVVANGVDCVAQSVDPKKSKKDAQVNLETVVANGVDCVAPSVDPKKSKQDAQVNLENVVANGVDCVAPSVDPKKSTQVAIVNLENEDVGDDDCLDVSVQHTLPSSQLGNMETEEATSFSNLINKARQEDQGDGSCKWSQKMVKMSTEPKLIKGNKQGLERARMLKELMIRQNATQQSVLKVTKTSGVNQVGDSSISASIGVINRMVDEGLMTACSELWCFAVNLFEDDVKRELFMSLPDDVGRLAWLQYKQKLGN